VRVSSPGARNMGASCAGSGARTSGCLPETMLPWTPKWNGYGRWWTWAATSHASTIASRRCRMEECAVLLANGCARYSSSESDGTLKRSNVRTLGSTAAGPAVSQRSPAPSARTPDSVSSPGSLLLRCYSLLRPYWRLEVGIVLALIGIDAALLITPQIIRLSVDRGIEGGDIPFLFRAVLVLWGVTAVKGISASSRAAGSRSPRRGGLRSAQCIHRKLASLSFSYHEPRPKPDSSFRRAVQDVERVRFLDGRATLRLVDGTFLLASTAVGPPVHGSLASACWCCSAAAAGTPGDRLSARLIRPISRAIQDSLGVLTTRLEQNLRGARVVEGLRAGRSEIARFNEENAHWLDLSILSARIQAINAPLLNPHFPISPRS